jgi:hypothetical protein
MTISTTLAGVDTAGRVSGRFWGCRDSESAFADSESAGVTT